MWICLGFIFFLKPPAISFLQTLTRSHSDLFSVILGLHRSYHFHRHFHNSQVSERFWLKGPVLTCWELSFLNYKTGIVVSTLCFTSSCGYCDEMKQVKGLCNFHGLWSGKINSDYFNKDNCFKSISLIKRLHFFHDVPKPPSQFYVQRSLLSFSALFGVPRPLSSQRSIVVFSRNSFFPKERHTYFHILSLIAS